MASPISTRTTVIICLESFNQLAERSEQTYYRREDEVASVSWMDELGRLRVWAANTGALHTGQSSLDFQLRDASHINQQVVELLRDLWHTIIETMDTLSEDMLDASDDGASDDGASDDGESLDAGPDETPKTQLQQLYEGVVTIIDCLYRMSMLIRKPAEHDLLIGAHESEKAQFELHNNQHIYNMHPEADEHIAQRLKRTILQRRRDLDARARRHDNLERGMEEAQSFHDTTTEDAISKNIVAEEQDVEFKQSLSKSGISRSSRAASPIDRRQISVPAPPKESAEGKPFRCPYCFFVLKPRDMRSWARHVFRDIKPYVCVFPDCNTPDRLYDTRREWAFHETTHHNTESPLCPLCKETCGSSKIFERHVARHLEELALLSLPRDEVEDEQEEGRSYVPFSRSGAYTALDSADSESTDDDMEGGYATELVSYKVEPAGVVGEESEGLESLGERLTLSVEAEIPAQGSEGAYDLGTRTDSIKDQASGRQTPSKSGASAKGLRAKLALASSGKWKQRIFPFPHRRLEPSEASSKVDFYSLPLPPSTHSRLPSHDELYVMEAFARHACHCLVCVHPYEVHRKGGSLCPEGHRRALDLAQYIFSKNGRAYSLADLDGNRLVEMEISNELVVVRELLKAMERGLRLRRKVRPVSFDETCKVPSTVIEPDRSIPWVPPPVPLTSHLRRPMLFSTNRGSLYEAAVKERERRHQSRHTGSSDSLIVPAKDHVYYR